MEFSIALHDLAIEEKKAFFEGCGIRQRDFAQIASAIKGFTILNYFSLVVKALRKNDKPALERLKLRLNGDLGLYSLRSLGLERSITSDLLYQFHQFDTHLPAEFRVNDDASFIIYSEQRTCIVCIAHTFDYGYTI